MSRFQCLPGGAAAILAAITGCAFGDGDPFAVLHAELDASFVVEESRKFGEKGIRLVSDFEIEVDELNVDFGPMELIAVAPDVPVFDAAAPPEGYSLCHNGHCHRDDGALIPYEEIARELAEQAGGGSAEPPVVLSAEQVDLLGAEGMVLECSPSCVLPRTQIGFLTLPIQSIQGSGRVRDTRVPPRIGSEVAWTLTLAGGEEPLVELTQEVEIVASRHGDPTPELNLTVAIGALIFDPVPWEELDIVGMAAEVSANQEAASAIVEALHEIEVETHVD